LSDWARKVSGGWLLAVFVQPGAKQSEIAGEHGDALRIRVAAPPSEGRANDALLALLSETLGIPKRSVRVVKGASARRKSVLIAAPQADPARLLRGATN
jgi:uncharacterized protein (TIGR00251 family)